MRRLIASVVAGVVAGFVLVVVEGVAPAWAGDDCPRAGPNGICLSDETHPSVPEPANPGPGNENTSGGNSSCPNSECTNEYGFTWLPGGTGPGSPGGAGCYGFMLDPQPRAGSPLWKGHDPSEGSIWSCDPTISVPENTWFVANGQAQVVDAAAVAQRMLARAPFEVANVQMAPPYGFLTYIRIENWFWVPENQWHDVSLTEDVGPASVTLNATPSQLVIDTGNNAPAPTRCYDAGWPWRKGMSDAAKTTCSYAYESIEKPEGDTYNVSGRLYYAVSWTCSGLCSAPVGDLGEYPAPESEQHPVEVRQRQTVVTQ